MERSVVWLRIYFLRALRDGDRTTRLYMIDAMNREQMNAMTRVVKFLLNGRIHVMGRDALVFARFDTMMRGLVSRRVSLDRKKTSLKRHLSLLPRLLRGRYLIQAIHLDTSEE